jgi:hypothetical protein
VDDAYSRLDTCTQSLYRGIRRTVSQMIQS